MQIDGKTHGSMKDERAEDTHSNEGDTRERAREREDRKKEWNLAGNKKVTCETHSGRANK